MLKAEDIRIEVGRTVGGDFIKVVHKPTGIVRSQGPPLLKPGKIQHEFLRQIEEELIKQGLVQYIVQTGRRNDDGQH